ncbi:ATP-binding cassette domain-containing protein [Gordonia sp. HNM0687]|uniref:ATP-binding cassette domain-containing protein n=1 Tax=Gordonia mangrovi TaxID=2665643 RepID=A0A6L7GQP2_9ACTN|nr:ABC transporter ATP-binding protein [Gordonia mangrovi]MXP22206.1 ATP-binding cassette domain-containing protein [Gordonia mangrovi]UVF77889.1 ABC transporter ATP-binding protein [Gordonia mangrovi]
MSTDNAVSTDRGATTRPALHVTGLVKRYDEHTAVDGLDLRLEPGSILALLGPNGAGKTTTVEICEGFLTADAGCVRVLGLDPIADNDALRRRIGVMLQGGGAYPGARAEEMLRLCASYSADPIDPGWLLDVLGLADCARTSFRRLSGGQQQRLSLACAIVGRPELVFLDEPTAGLDAHARILVWELIDRLRGDGVSVLLTTHLMDEAEELADDVVIIDHGRVVAAGTPADLTSRGAENELRFSAPRGLDVALLLLALPEGYRCTETAPGSYLVHGPVTPQVLATVTAWFAKIDVLATDLRVETRSLSDVFLDLTGRALRS